MDLHFGFDFDGIVHAPPPRQRAGALYVGLGRLLPWLELQLGLSGYAENTDYLRIELYRQALQQHLAACEAQPLFAAEPFYAASLRTDALAVAAALLTWRDELVLAGWDVAESADDAPARLASLAQVERIFQQKINDPEHAALARGVADRFARVLAALEHRPVGIDRVVLYEPEAWQEPVMRRLLAVWRGQGIAIEEQPVQASARAGTRLHWLQRLLLGEERIKFIGRANADPDTPEPIDSSLLVLRVRRDSDGAAFLARLLRRNPEFRPLLLLPELNLLLEQALTLEGFPALGVLSASLARPSLQVLKLAPAFLWEPVDVFKLMEFVTLPVKPFDDGLALEIARVLAARPGLNSDTWYAAVLGYLERPGLPASARQHYDFWFDRRRYAADSAAPKRDAVAIYNYLRTWALQQYADTGSKHGSLLVLAEQARRIRDLLEALPETRITFLELERIVRTIYEPSPAALDPAEQGHFPFVHQPGALAAPCDALVWWNCVFADTTPAPDKWRADERQWLSGRGVELLSVQADSKRRIARQHRPVLQTTSQLVLVVPEQVDGSEQPPSLLLGDIEAAFGNTAAFCYHLDRPDDRRALEALFELPQLVALPARPPAPPRPHLPLRRPDLVPASEYETPTQLELLFYYPHRWFFRQKMRLFPASLFSVTRDQTLLGNLAHRFFELLLKEDFTAWDRAAVNDWINRNAAGLLEREGATLLLYGREPERNAFLARVRNAAWSLIALLRANEWTVEATEMPLEGEFGGVPMRGKADLVLRRGEERAIVDLKWSGAKRRKEMIRNGEDLQLVLYARWLEPADQWAHTAYFILEDGKMIARTTAAFREAITPVRCDDHASVCADIYARMERTFAWRLQQIAQGQLELRTAHTAPTLERLYAGDDMFDLLEMKSEDGRWDEYRGLLDFSL